MRESFKQWLERTVKSIWLVIIIREIDKYYKLNKKTQIQQYVVNALLEKYKGLYGESFVDSISKR